MITILLVITLSYLLGSIPFAYILIRLKLDDDIRVLGSGNVGAMNSYEITGKKWIGIVVFLLDMFKGLLAILIVLNIPGISFLHIALTSSFVIIGHNYSVFMRFRGGKGLAAAVGIASLISPIAILIWGICWSIVFIFINRDIIWGSITATIATPVIFFLLPHYLINYFNLVLPSEIYLLRILLAVICILIMIKFIGPLKDLLAKKANQ